MPTDRRVAFWPRRRAVVDGDGGRGRQGGGRDRASRAPRPAATATAPAGRPPSLRGELEVRPSRRRGRLLAVQTDQIYCVRGSARTSLRHRAPSHGQQVRRRHVRSRRPAADQPPPVAVSLLLHVAIGATTLRDPRDASPPTLWRLWRLSIFRPLELLQPTVVFFAAWAAWAA